jgi:hypothetical protein
MTAGSQEEVLVTEGRFVIAAHDLRALLVCIVLE